MVTNKSDVDLHDVATQRRVAAAALCDPRSVAKYARGEKVRPLLAARIQQAVREQEVRR